MVRREKPITDITEAFSELSSTLAKVAVAPNVNNYVPHVKQQNFHTADKYMRLYIGGNRSGKTTGGVVEDFWWLTGTHPYQETPDPRYRPVMGRLVSVDFINGIKKIIIPQLKQWFPPSYLQGGSWFTAYSESERLLTLENGSQLELMSYDQDLDKFAGTSRDFVHFDEEPPEDIFTECKMRLIDRAGKLWFTMTPVEGMTWMFDSVYEPGILGDPDISVTEVDMSENPYINQVEQEKALKGLSPEERQARKSGKFVQLGGLVYRKFNLETHVIDPVDFREFLDPRKYKLWMSLDHGLNNPTAVYWHAVDTFGNVITFDEHYEAQQIVKYHATVIHDRNSLHGRVPDISVCDPALAQRSAVTGTSIQTEYAILGIGFALANNDIVTGIEKVTEYLTLRPDGTPTWRITANCQKLIGEIQRYRWKTWSNKKQGNANNAYEVPHKKNDHAMDSIRYFFSFMPKLGFDPPVEEKTSLRSLMGSEAGSKGLSHEFMRIDSNLTPEALSGNSGSTQWREILNDDWIG